MRVFFLFCSLITPYLLLSQITPKENDTLNYRIVGFSFPKIKKATEYKIEIAEGNFNSETAFYKNLVETITSKENKIIAEVPHFGRQYTWRVRSADNSSDSKKTTFYHFSTGFVIDVDSSQTRLRITRPTDKYKYGYVLTDGNKVMYDIAGNPVWYLPDKGENFQRKGQIRDLKVTAMGTITFVTEGHAYEINYDGNILWSGPNSRKRNSDTLEGYHHEMTRLGNGHYMVLAFEPMAKSNMMVMNDGTHRRIIGDSLGHRVNTKPQRKPRFGTIMEYDEAGNLVWTWKAADYFKSQDMSFYIRPNGMPEQDVHQNSFFFDEKNKVIYLSFRNISQVLKISYPSGDVITAYGKMTSPYDVVPSHPFCGQHSCKISKQGYLYLYNNGCDPVSAPTVVMMQEPLTDKDTLRKIWEYKWPPEENRSNLVDSNRGAMMSRDIFSSGGNVIELQDSSLFVSTNAPYSEVFIVSMNKEKVWSAEAERWLPEKNMWIPCIQYRASIITEPEQLEKLIWSSTHE